MKFPVPYDLRSTLPLSLHADWESLLSAHEHPAVTSIRLNPFKGLHSFEQATSVPWCERAYYLQERPFFTADPLLHAGCYYVQEASSMFLDHALRFCLPKSDHLRVVDLCASPGGKSTLVAGLLKETDLLLSNEMVPNRIQALVENTVKWGYANQWVSNNTAAQIGRLEGYFDVLLIDAPCSGSGLFRKMPEFRSEWNLNLVQQCAVRQKSIIQDALPSLSEHGILIYMTCSLSEQENEQMIDYILNNNDLEPLSIPIPDNWGVLPTTGTQGNGYGYRFMPNHLNGEGFFLTAFRRTKGPHRNISTPKHNTYKPSNLDIPYLNTQELKTYQIKEHPFLIHPEHITDVNYLEKSLRLVKKGTLLGKWAGKELIPDHELSMSVYLSKELEYIELDRMQALNYLKKETIHPGETTKGWKLVRYLKHELGWVKSVPGRVNNYYPAAYRILTKTIG